MKKFVPLLMMILLLAVAVPQVRAQAPNPIFLGARAGVNMGQLSLTPDVPSGVSKSFRTGIAGGLFADIGVAEAFFIDIEALYLQGGVKFTGGGGEATVKLDDIVIPVSGKYKFPIQNSTVKPYVFAGGDIAFNMKAESEAGGVSVDIKDSVESLNYGAHFGAGVEFEVSPGVNLFFDGRYNIGFKDVDKRASSEAKPWGIAILAGVSFKAN